MAHTPGPWHVSSFNHEVSKSYGNWSVLNLKIAKCHPIDIGEAQANAHLIAAAPELKESGHILAVLVLQSHTYQSNMDIRDAVDDFLAVETKAEGK